MCISSILPASTMEAESLPGGMELGCIFETRLQSWRQLHFQSFMATPSLSMRCVWVWAGPSCSVEVVRWLSRSSLLTHTLKGSCRRWDPRVWGGYPRKEEYGKVERHKRSKAVWVEGPLSPLPGCMSHRHWLSRAFWALSIHEAHPSFFLAHCLVATLCFCCIYWFLLWILPWNE